MFDPRFNNNFQNTVPDQNTGFDPYKNQYLSQNDRTAYNQQGNMAQGMPGDTSANNFYPLGNQGLNNFVGSNNPANINYAEGGEVKKTKKKQSKFPNLYPSLAEMIKQQGGEEDTILAHINPLEAMMLQQMGGSGTTNPVTGLPQFGFFNKPWKALKSVLGGTGGSILGNMILPGVGGIIGGALGQGAQHAARGKSFGQGALKGGAMGAALPTVAGLAGSGAAALGMNSPGNFLSNYGAQNAILPSLGLGSGGISAGGGGASSGSALSNSISGTGGGGLTASAGTGNVNGIGALGEAAKGSWYDKWLEPRNLLTAATVAGSFMNRPKEKKEKSPEQIAAEEKRYRNASRSSRGEIEADEAAEFLKKQANYRLRHNLAGGESLAASPVYRKVNSPEDYRKKGRWLEYHDNTSFSGNPLMMKMGGSTDYGIEDMGYPTEGLGRYMQGGTGGQDDKIPARLSDGEYVIPADVVSHAGDGNNQAGAMKFDALLKNIRKAKGGSIHLPPKAKSLANYMTR